MARVTRIGVDEAQRELAAMAKGEEVLEKVARPALRIGGEAAVEIARGIAPRRTGRFADSIHMEGGDGAVGGDESLGPEADTATRTSVVVGTTLWYGGFVEFGGRHNPARRPVGQAVDVVDEVIRDALDHYMGEWLEGLG